MPTKLFISFTSISKGTGTLKVASGGPSGGLDSWTRGAAGGVVFGAKVELPSVSVAVLSGLKLNLGGLSSGLEPLEFGVFGFNDAEELLGCETDISGVGSPNVPTFANGFGLEDGVPNMVGGGTKGWALGSKPAGFFDESTFGLEVKASWVPFFASSSEWPVMNRDSSFEPGELMVPTGSWTKPWACASDALRPLMTAGNVRPNRFDSTNASEKICLRRKLESVMWSAAWFSLIS